MYIRNPKRVLSIEAALTRGKFEVGTQRCFGVADTVVLQRNNRLLASKLMGGRRLFENAVYPFIFLTCRIPSSGFSEDLWRQHSQAAWLRVWFSGQDLGPRMAFIFRSKSSPKYETRFHGARKCWRHVLSENLKPGVPKAREKELTLLKYLSRSGVCDPRNRSWCWALHAFCCFFSINLMGYLYLQRWVSWVSRHKTQIFRFGFDFRA